MPQEHTSQPPSGGTSEDYESRNPVCQPCILFAEPDHDLRLSCGRLLEQAGYEVKEVDDGEVAWEALLSSHYDLVIAEQIMPGASGPSLVRRMRVAHMWQPVILTSSTQNLEDVWTRDPWQRVDIILTKPFTGAELINRIDDVLHSPSRTPFSFARAAGH